MKVIVTISDPIFSEAKWEDKKRMIVQTNAFGGFLDQVILFGQSVLEIAPDTTTQCLEYQYRDYFRYEKELIPKAWQDMELCPMSEMANYLSQFVRKHRY